MSNLIEKIWKEEYMPSGEQVLYGEQIMRASRMLDVKERELWERLSDENRTLFDEVMSAYYNMVDYYKLDAYIQGARFVGSLLKEITRGE